MEANLLHIKNMVCPRCIMAVEQLLKEEEVKFTDVELGKVQLLQPLTITQKKTVKDKLDILGFELLEPGKSSLITRIKSLIIQQIHHSDEQLNMNFSTFLSENLHHEYTYLSRLFSSVEGITIEKFVTRQKVEKVKELLFYDELTLSEIAFQMNYSSVAYLSSQFKKETGMTTSQFKSTHQPGHQHLDSL